MAPIFEKHVPIFDEHGPIFEKPGPIFEEHDSSVHIPQTSYDVKSQLCYVISSSIILHLYRTSFSESESHHAVF